MADKDDALDGWNANRGIIGLAPPPWNENDGMDWPTDGYDGTLYGHKWGEHYDQHGLAASGHTAEEWAALADEMIARWTAWKAHLLALVEK